MGNQQPTTILPADSAREIRPASPAKDRYYQACVQDIHRSLTKTMQEEENPKLFCASCPVRNLTRKQCDLLIQDLTQAGYKDATVKYCDWGFYEAADWDFSFHL